MSITYGVELETVTPSGFGRNLPDGWVGRSDCSIHTRGYATHGREYVSPILNGATGLQSIKEMCAALVAGNVKANASCGLHVHVDASGFDESDIARFKNLYTVYEYGILAISGTNMERRLVSDHARTYCRSACNWGNRSDADDRYRGLNLTNYYRAKRNAERHPDQPVSKNTVEFRCWAGTVNAKEVIAAVTIARGIANTIKYAKTDRAVRDAISAMGTKKAGLPIAALNGLIGTIFNRNHPAYSGIALDAETKTFMVAQARKAENKLLSL